MSMRPAFFCNNCDSNIPKGTGVCVRVSSKADVQFSNHSGTKTLKVDMNLDFCDSGCAQIWLKEKFEEVKNS